SSRHDPSSRTGEVLTCNGITRVTETQADREIKRVELVELLELPLQAAPDALVDRGVDLLALLDHSPARLRWCVLARVITSHHIGRSTDTIRVLDQQVQKVEHHSAGFTNLQRYDVIAQVITCRIHSVPTEGTELDLATADLRTTTQEAASSIAQRSG